MYVKPKRHTMLLFTFHLLQYIICIHTVTLLPTYLTSDVTAQRRYFIFKTVCFIHAIIAYKHISAFQIAKATTIVIKPS